MRQPHSIAAAGFLADPSKVAWHDAAVWHVRARRDAAVRALPDWPTLRADARAIRRLSLDRLDEWVAAFAQQAARNGVHVHWADDAAALRTTVTAILSAAGARKVVKSKSMLTEECGLNPHLEACGFEVTDTDLGERIVQLRREPPSHIVMPALHLRREEVGRTFAQHLGTPPDETDPTRLTEAARAHLRRRFLDADAGITGVNFAVAEDGTFVVCTNEGNADLGAHLPPLHIAVMGIDKVIPRRAHLSVLLRLLARSATGQPITAYTSLFRSPAPGGAIHLIVVDNGRSDLLADPTMRASLACIRCGACLNTCPVYRRTGGHSYGEGALPGPIGAVLAAGRDPAQFADLPHACSLCGSCQTVCPVDVPLPRQLRDLRARAPVTLHRRWIRSVVKFATMGGPRRVRWIRRIVGWTQWLTPVVLRWFGRRAPVPARQSFREQWANRQPPPRNTP